MNENKVSPNIDVERRTKRIERLVLEGRKPKQKHLDQVRFYYICNKYFAAAAEMARRTGREKDAENFQEIVDEYEPSELIKKLSVRELDKKGLVRNDKGELSFSREYIGVREPVKVAWIKLEVGTNDGIEEALRILYEEVEDPKKICDYISPEILIKRGDKISEKNILAAGTLYWLARHTEGLRKVNETLGYELYPVNYEHHLDVDIDPMRIWILLQSKKFNKVMAMLGEFKGKHPDIDYYLAEALFGQRKEAGNLDARSLEKIVSLYTGAIKSVENPAPSYLGRAKAYIAWADFTQEKKEELLGKAKQDIRDYIKATTWKDKEGSEVKTYDEGEVNAQLDAIKVKLGGVER